MSRFNTPLWRNRLANIALLAGVFAIGVWVDSARGRVPDFFDPQTAIVALIFAWLLAETALPLTARLPAALAPYLAGMAAFGVVFCALAYALPSFMVGMIQAPFGGLALIRSVFDGLFFTLRQAAVPALACGALAGLACGIIRGRPKLPATTL